MISLTPSISVIINLIYGNFLPHDDIIMTYDMTPLMLDKYAVKKDHQAYAV